MSGQGHAAVAGAPSGVVRALARFTVSHGGFATAVLENLGREGIRIVVIGEDGTWGDQVVADRRVALAACEAAKVDVAASWTRELSGALGYRH